jgi:ABC-type sugar transport system ATPase subunit
MPEVLGIADKILVMHKDTIVAEVVREDASQDELLRYAMGLSHRMAYAEGRLSKGV